MATRFAASLRRKLFRSKFTGSPFSMEPSAHVLSEHLGLVEPQIISSNKDPVTSFMRPSPIPNDDESELEETQQVIDPLNDGKNIPFTLLRVR